MSEYRGKHQKQAQKQELQKKKLLEGLQTKQQTKLIRRAARRVETAVRQEPALVEVVVVQQLQVLHCSLLVIHMFMVDQVLQTVQTVPDLL